MSPSRSSLRSLPFGFSTFDLRAAYYFIQMAEHISDDSSTDEDTRAENRALYPVLRTTEEEREYGSIPGSPVATAAALAHRTAQTNPTVPRTPLRLKKRTKPKTKTPSKAKATSSKTTSSVCTLL